MWLSSPTPTSCMAIVWLLPVNGTVRCGVGGAFVSPGFDVFPSRTECSAPSVREHESPLPDMEGAKEAQDVVDEPGLVDRVASSPEIDSAVHPPGEEGGATKAGRVDLPCIA